MLFRKLFSTIIPFLFFLINGYAQNDSLVGIHGIVVDANNRALSFATVDLLLYGQPLQSVKTDNNGQFSFSDLSYFTNDSLTLNVSYADKSPQAIQLYKKDYRRPLRFILQNLSLTLKEVVVTGVVQKLNSASSIVFDEEAIRQMQAFSLMDVLNSLPGRKTSAPDLQSPQTLTLRTSATGADAMNNSFGIAIFIDGIRINNETNMQARNFSYRGTGGSLVNNGQTTTSDVTFNGFDLRDIPISNIEKIEVIQGVGSARYGDFSNGAILITTKAGATPYSLTTNLNGSSVSLSLSKGFNLQPKWGAINYSLGYTKSLDDPRDNLKSYGNVSGSIKWSVAGGKTWTNSLTLNLDGNLDRVYADPDDDNQKSSYSKRRNLRLSNITNINFKKSFLSRASISFSYSYGIQHSYTQYLINGLPKGIADKDTTGVYEGYYIPGNYMAVEEIDGKPVSFSNNIDIDTKSLKWLGAQHKIGFGFSYSTSGNLGRGNIVNPNAPRWVDVSSINERPFSYKDNVDFLANIGFYIQDDIRGKLFDRPYSINIGTRWNLQAGRGNPQPRVSFNYILDEHWNFSTSYGLSLKSPSLADMYPSPTFFDIPLLSLYTGYTKNSVYLVYTKKIEADNRKLKMAASQQWEQVINYVSKKIGNLSLDLFYKKNDNGFNAFSEFVPFYVPEYNYSINKDSTIHYFPTGNQSIIYDLSRRRMNNGLNSTDWGFQFSFQSNEIKAIATSISLRGGLTKSTYRGTNSINTVASNLAQAQQGYMYIFYDTLPRVVGSAVYTISTNTHIPQIGFIVNLIADYEPVTQQHWDARNIYPRGYTRFDGTTVLLSDVEAKNEEYTILRKTQQDGKSYSASKGFWNLNIRVAKEIRKKIRLSLSAYNFLNFKTTMFRYENNVFSSYSYKPISITVGASFQL